MAREDSVYLILSLLAFFIFVKGFFETRTKGNGFKTTPYLSFLGIFVWADAIVLGIFWFVIFLVSYFLKNRYLLFFVISLFWVIRSLGEIIYWLNQQFSLIKRNPPEKLFGYFLIKNESIWFIYQLFWQCVLLISVISSVYFGGSWLGSLK